MHLTPIESSTAPLRTGIVDARRYIPPVLELVATGASTASSRLWSLLGKTLRGASLEPTTKVIATREPAGA